MEVASKPCGWGSAAEQAHHVDVLPSILALLPRQDGLRILDAGCGNGFVAAQLAALGHHLTGVDTSADGIQVARAAYPEVCYAVASVYDNLSSFMPSKGWDVIVSSEVIEHLYSPRTFLRNMHTPLRPGGSIILTTPYHGYFKDLAISLLNCWDKHFTVDWEDGHIKFFSPISLTRMLREAGFLRPTFRNAGRLPLLWRSMVCRADKQEET